MPVLRNGNRFPQMQWYVLQSYDILLKFWNRMNSIYISIKKTKVVGTGGGGKGGLAPLPIFFSDVKVPFFNNHVNTFYLAWHKVESCFRCIKFACSVMWVIVFHDISWCMYVNSLVVCSLISNRTILWIILGRILSTAFVHIHENEWIPADALSEKP